MNVHMGSNRLSSMELAQQLAALAGMKAAQLRQEYLGLFGVPTPSHNRVWLTRRIAWRLQALAEGDLSERARQRAVELAHDADLRLTAPAVNDVSHEPLEAIATRGRQAHADGLRIGSILTRRYQGVVLEVHVRADGFAYRGTLYRSLSAVAKAITGSHQSGPAFFHLLANRGAR